MYDKPKLSFAKGASLYKAHWEQLKSNPHKSISYELDKLSQLKFKKALVKRKWLDAEFKNKYPEAKLMFTHENNKLVVTLLLTTDLLHVLK